MAHGEEVEAPDTGRFVIEGRVGVGGMGVVYRAYDRERSAHVALKTLRKVNPASLHRFKREFRALAEIAHPNLVSLYELIAEDESWFFTMELLEGVDFRRFALRDPAPTPVAHVLNTPGRYDTRKGAATGDHATGTRPTQTSPGSASSGSAPGASRSPPELDYDKLRDSLRQLATGVSALHEHGHLHRDIKPSNVMVTREGRVVLLDFGVITEMAGPRWGRREAGVVGTPAYMAPELAAGAAASRASDWYGVGMVLYETLTATLPFRGELQAMIEERQRTPVPPPREHNPEVPQELDELCEALLRIDPSERPTGDDVLARLGAPRTAAAPPTAARWSDDTTPLIGRTAELAALYEAFQETNRGVGVSVYTHASSGMGKTALIRRFLDEVTKDPDVVVLTGRCYEQESVPYRAVDSLVDALCWFLADLPRGKAEALIPRDVHMLARVFPVLRRVEAVAQAKRREAASADPHELRRRAFAALRELLGRLASERPLVLFIDDLQWGDADSAPLLAELMRPPDAPPLLMIAAYRTEDAERSALLRALSRRESRLGPASNARDIVLSPLADDAAEELAATLLEARGAKSIAPSVISRESRGNPYFIHELANFFDAAEQSAPAEAVTLEELIKARVRVLPDEARELLEIVVVAGKPTERRVIHYAGGGEPGNRPAMWKLLRSRHLVRMSGSRQADVVEAYHDRIRETIVSTLSKERLRDCHRRLAVAIQTLAPDAETLAAHFHAAGDDEAAAIYSMEAADQAASALAFDRAAELYQRTATLMSVEPDVARELYIKLGDALFNAGRSIEAAEAFLRVADGADAATRLSSQRLAAECLLRGGDIDRGLDTIGDLLRDTRIPYPDSPKRALLGVLWQRLKLRLRGRRWKQRSLDEIPPRELTRLDVYRAVAFGLAMVDNIRATYFNSRRLLYALRTGEPRHVGQSLAHEAIYQACQGGRGLNRARTLAREVEHVVTLNDDPYLRAWAGAAAAYVTYFAGDFGEGAARFHEVERLLAAQTGTSWEVGTVRLFRLFCLRQMGAFTELNQVFFPSVRDAHRRGDRYTETTLRRACNVVWLALGDPESARSDLEQTLWTPPAGGYHLQHWYGLRARGELALYEGSGAQALAETEPDYIALARSLSLRIQPTRTEARWLRARLLIAATKDTESPETREASKLAKLLEREGIAYATVWATLVRAGIASRLGDQETAAACFRSVADLAEQQRMLVCSAAARWRLGEILGGDEGAALLTAAREWMQRESVADPARMVEIVAPGR